MFSRIGTVEFTRLLLWPGLGKSKIEQAMALATANIFPRLHRPGSVLAGAWAAMQYMGHKYVLFHVISCIILSPRSLFAIALITQWLSRILSLYRFLRKDD